MSNVRGIFTRRSEVVTSPPDQHLMWLLKEVAKDFEQGEWTRGNQNLCHAVYVAATTGPQGLSEHDLVHLLRGITGHGFDPGEAA